MKDQTYKVYNKYTGQSEGEETGVIIRKYGSLQAVQGRMLQAVDFKRNSTEPPITIFLDRAEIQQKDPYML